MVTKAILDVSIKGIGKLHKTSIFPCGIFQYWGGVNDKPNTPNYDLKRLALYSTAKRLYPNYCNCDWSNQRKAIADDRRIKKEIIDSLTDNQKNALVSRLKENLSLCDKLDILLSSVDNEELSINMDCEHPYEISSTMGKRKLSPSKTL